MPAPSIPYVPLWTTVPKAAPLFGLGEHRILALIQAGDVDGYKSDDDGRGTWFVSTESLDQWHRARMQAQRVRVDDAVNRVRRRVVAK